MSNIYTDWLHTSLLKINEDFFSGVFQPNNESDFKCHLYHLLFLTKPSNDMKITTEYRHHKLAGSIDMVLGEEINGFQPRICIELKDSSGESRSFLFMKNRLDNNIQVLQYMKKINRKVKLYVLYWFWGAKNGIDEKLKEEMNRLQNEYSDIKFLYGPVKRVRVFNQVMGD